LTPVSTASLYVAFTARRRGAGTINCLICGTRVHQHIDEPGQSFDPTLPWYDGHCDSFDSDPVPHDHTPAHEIGPTFGPLTSVELTGEVCRVEGEALAVWVAGRGDWVLTGLAAEFAGQAYSDAWILPATRSASCSG
jgi:hypothetical protein